jgi:hypothetical protein
MIPDPPDGAEGRAAFAARIVSSKSIGIFRLRLHEITNLRVVPEELA